MQKHFSSDCKESLINHGSIAPIDFLHVSCCTSSELFHAYSINDYSCDVSSFISYIFVYTILKEKLNRRFTSDITTFQFFLSSAPVMLSVVSSNSYEYTQSLPRNLFPQSIAAFSCSWNCSRVCLPAHFCSILYDSSYFSGKQLFRSSSIPPFVSTYSCFCSPPTGFFIRHVAKSIFKCLAWVGYHGPSLSPVFPLVFFVFESIKQFFRMCKLI